MAKSVANFQKSQEDFEIKEVYSQHYLNGSTISPPMRNSMLSSQQELQPLRNNQSQQAFELPFRMNAPSELSQEREHGAHSKSRGGATE